ncbi:MAG: ATP-dependent metallopeptidase FtsH/Yme1/Tma family protein [Desulfobulbus sp.]
MPQDLQNKQPDSFADRLRNVFNRGAPQSKKNDQSPKGPFNIWLSLLVLLFFFYLQPYFFSAKVESIPYSQFKQLLADGKVADLTLSPENITGTLPETPAKEFTTIRVNDPGLVKALDEQKVSYSGWYQTKQPPTVSRWV